MTTIIQKWGNSQGIRIPKTLLEEVDFKENQVVEVKANEGKLIIEKSEKRPKKSIEELFEGYNGDYKPEEINWGESEGAELW